MKVTRDEALEMFTSLGYKTAEKWDAERMEKKLNKLPGLVEKSDAVTPEIMEDMEQAEPKMLVNRICRTVNGGEKVELERPPVSDEGETKMSKKQKEKKNRGRVMSVAEYEGRKEDPKPKTKKKDKTAKDKPRPVGKEKKVKKGTEPGQKEKKSSVAVDACNRRLGTQGAAIDAAMGTKAWTSKDLAEKTNLPTRRIIQHLTWLVKEGYAEKTDKGYKLTVKI